MKKIFVLDTNVILHDSSSVFQFEDNDVAIPITVLEELDKFKKGNEELNYHAREFVRTIDKLSDDQIFQRGVKLGDKLGRMIVTYFPKLHPDLDMNFNHNNPDHRILNSAYTLSKKRPTRKIVFISKDVNLRLKAKAVGLTAEDFNSDHVQDISQLYTGMHTETGVPEQVVDALYKEPYELDANELEASKTFLHNQYLILRNGKKSAIALYDKTNSLIKRVEKYPVFGITPRNAEQTFALNALMNTDIPLVTIGGKAGTGKTLLALAAALERHKEYKQIFLARPIVPLSNKDIGYLPGDIQSKLDPYMQPLFDNLGVIQNQFANNENRYQQIAKFLEQEKLKISPLSYIRGRSLVKICFIVDEAQNLTPLEVKTIITRAGEGTKVIFTGDIFQIDHPYLDSRSNGLSYLIEKMQGQPLYAHVQLERGERSELADLASDLL